MPSLGGIPAEYNHFVGSDKIHQLCKELVDQTLADERLWAEVGKNPIRFIGTALTNWVNKQGGSELDNHMDLCVSIEDHESSYHNDQPDPGGLYMDISCNGCAYLVTRPAIDALEKRAKGLGSAFYAILMGSLHSFIHTWDAFEAAASIEYMKESALDEAEMDGHGNPKDPEAALSQYEFPDLEACTPACLVTKSNKPKEMSEAKQLALLKKHVGSERFGEWITTLLDLHSLAQQRPGDELVRHEDYYEDGTPLPAMVVVFEQYDAIEATFDEAAQYMNECEHAPLLRLRIDANDRSDICVMLTRLNHFIQLSVRACKLAEQLNKFAGIRKS